MIDERNCTSSSERIGLCFLSASVMFAVFQLILSWNEPILDQYAFRQTQTAISAYWLLKGGPWLGYQTPILGAPWSIPFEFPLYQWIVAIFARALPFLTLDQAGRVVSETFFLACLWPLHRIIIRHKYSEAFFYFAAGALMFSPLYAFWSRSFMMESTVLFFSLWFVASLADYLSEQRSILLLEIFVTATVAVCIKVTTFYGFAIFGAMLLMGALWCERQRLNAKIFLTKYCMVALIVAISLGIFLIWLHYSDIIKSENPISTQLTGPNLRAWNFGTLKQRLTRKLYEAMLLRGPTEALGSWFIVAFIISVAVASVRDLNFTVLAALIGIYVIVFLTFTNVQVVHHYYQYANSIFLIIAIAYCLYKITQRTPWLGATLFAILAIGNCVTFYNVYFHDMVRPGRQLQAELARYVRSNTPVGSVFVGFGLTYDSEIPYYGERRALLLPDGMVSVDLLDQLRADPSKFVGQHKISLVVVCPNGIANDASTRSAYQALLRSLTGGSEPIPVGYCEVFPVNRGAGLG